MDIGFPKALADFERLFPLQTPSAAGVLHTPLHALRSLAAPMVIAGRFALGRGSSSLSNDDERMPAGAKNEVMDLCPICGEPLDDSETTICMMCRREVGAAS